MIAAKHFEAYRNAATYGYLNILKYLEAKTDQLPAMIASKHFEAFREGGKGSGSIFSGRDCKQIRSYLLFHPSVLAFAQANEEKYEKDIRKFVSKQGNLRSLGKNPHTHFQIPKPVDKKQSRYIDIRDLAY